MALETSPLNLQFLALLLLNNENIKSKISNKGLEFTGNKLASKIDILKPLGEMILITLKQNEYGDYRVASLYQKEGCIVVVLPDLNATITNIFEVKQWQAGDTNEALIVSKKGNISLLIPIAFTDYFLEEVRVNHNNQLEGDYSSLNPDWLRKAPEIELPLQLLPLSEVLTIKKSDARSKKYQTLLLDIESEDGTLFKNVISNSELRNLITNGCKQFKITGIKTLNVNSKDSKQKNRTIQKVLVEPTGINADFSDL